MSLNFRYLIIITCLSVIYGSEKSINDVSQTNLDCISDEGNSCEVKLSAALSLLRIEMLNNHKNMDESSKTKHDLEDSTDGKFHKLEKNIIDKLEEYIEGKLDSLEKLINRKIDALEKNIPDKIDIAIINRKIDGLNKIQTSLDENTTPDMKTSIIDEIEKRIPQYLKENINLKLNTMEKQIQNLTENKLANFKWYFFNNTIRDTNNDTRNLNENGKKKNVLSNLTNGYWECKERKVNNIHDFELIRLDDDTFKYVTLESDEEGVSHFEMHFAAKGTVVHIQLSPVPKPKKGDGYFLFEIFNTKATMFMSRPATDDRKSITYANSVLKQFTIPAVLVKEAYTAFHIKIKNGTLEVSEVGSAALLLQYTDRRFRNVQYIGFTSYPGHESSYLFDCPLHFEETIF